MRKCIREAECREDLQACILNEFADPYLTREFLDLHMMVRCARPLLAWL